MSEHKIEIAICNWQDRESDQISWTSLYNDIIKNGETFKFDAFGRNFGAPHYQVARPAVLDDRNIDSNIRYYCFNNDGTETVVYKETGYLGGGINF